MKLSIDILLFFLAVFLLRFSPIYYLGIKNMLLTTHIISIIIFLALFILFVYKAYKQKRTILNFKTEYLLILTFITTQSLSILTAQNIPVFWQRYSKIIIGFLIFIVIKQINQNLNKKKLINYLFIVFIVGFCVQLFFQLFLLLFPNQFFILGDLFIYKNVLDITKAHYFVSGKMFDDTYFEIIIPGLIYLFFNRQNRQPFFSSIWLILTLLVGLLAFVSNFRYRLVVFILFLLISIRLFSKEKLVLKKAVKEFFFLLFLVTCFFIVNKTVVIFTNQSIIDRFSFNENSEGFATVKWRFNMYGKSLDFAKSSIFGIGLGNFYDNLSNQKQLLSNFKDQKLVSFSALNAGPHNIFFQILAESGFLGFISFLALILFYLNKDFKSLIKKEEETNVFRLFFWTIMVVAQFFPSTNLTFYILFFMLRSLL